MTILKKLYSKQESLSKKKATGSASAMKLHRDRKAVQEEIDYYELGDSLSKETIQKELKEIQTLEKKISHLTEELNDKKQSLNRYIYGNHQVN